MSTHADYADRVSKRYGVLKRIGQPDATLEEGYVPQYVRPGPDYAEREWARAKESLISARRRANEAQIRERLEAQPPIDLIRRTPFGPSTSVREIVSRESRVVLLGEAGAGKTIALRDLATHPLSTSNEGAHFLTCIINLPELVASQCSLPEYLSEDAQQHMDLSLPPQMFQDMLVRGQALLCFDDLDAVPSQDDRARVAGQIESWARQYPRCKCIVTARADAYEPSLDPEQFAHFALVPWGEYSAADLEQVWNEVKADLTEKESEVQMASSRLLQDIAGARYLEAVLLESGLDALWDEVRSHLWDAAWRTKLGLTWRFLAEDHPDAWARLITRVLEAGKNDPLKRVLHRHLRAAAYGLAAAGATSGLDQSVRQTIIDGLVDWLTDPQAAGRHDAMDALFRLSGEPYAMERALQIIEDGERDEWSREAAALFLGEPGHPDAGRVVKALQVCMDDGEASTLLRQAAITSIGKLASRRVLDGELQAEVEDSMLARIRNPGRSLDLRSAMGESLGLIAAHTHGDAIIDALVSLARAENEDEKVPYTVQIAAARGLLHVLSAWRDPQLTERLWELARDEQVDDSVRSQLVRALGRLGNVAEAAHIALALARNPKVYPPGQREALDALGELEYSDETILEALLEIAESKDRKVKDFVRLAAARAITRTGNLDVGVQHLLMLVADKSLYRSTRNEALTFLGELGFSGDEDLDNATISVLLVWVTEENTTEDVRETAMQALCTLGANREDVIREWIGVIQDRKVYPRVRRSAAEMLGSLPVQHKNLVVEALNVTLYDSEEKSDPLRVPIAYLLSLWGEDEQALTYLKAAAEQSYMAAVRHKAAMYLAELDEMDQAASTLLALAEDSKIADPIRCNSLRALGLWRVGDQHLVDQVKPILQEEDLLPNVREAAYNCLKSITAA